MNSCHSCGGVIGRDCWNPQECAEITERMAIEQSQPDPAPSNANTSGLEVVAWLTTGGDVTRSEAYAKEQSVNDPDNYPSALVTAASAQARIDAAEARADRLAKVLLDARWYVSDHQESQPNDESRDLLALIDEVLK